MKPLKVECVDDIITLTRSHTSYRKIHREKEISEIYGLISTTPSIWTIKRAERLPPTFWHKDLYSMLRQYIDIDGKRV